jgi:protein-S-isoprenylcysteine O-methyltransferase Ste14
MSSLELKVPPPAVALVFGFLMWLASSLLAPVEFPAGPRVTAALTFASLGLAFGISGMVSFWPAKTSMNPNKPAATAALVTSGPFRFTRNPMYLSLLLYLSGWAVYLSAALAFLFLPAFVLYMNQFQIKPEERVLSALFGQGYAAYMKRVRRWL